METNEQSIFLLECGYDRRKEKEKALFRYMTIAEAKNLKYGDTVSFLAKDGTFRNVKINGQPKTWKRNPNRVSVSVKYGMYKFAKLETCGNSEQDFVKPLLVKAGLKIT